MPDTIKPIFFTEEVLALNEAGGFFSWLARFFNGLNENEIKKIEKELTGINTKAKKNSLLKDIDKFINEAERRKDDDNFVRAIKGYIVFGIPGAIWKTIATSSNSKNGKISAYISKLKSLRKKVEAIKVD